MKSMDQRPRLVVVGNGMAGMRTVEELLKLKPDMYAITVFGAEPWGNYNRILLSPVLAGEKTVDEIMLNGDAWYAEHDIRLHKGRRVTRVDRRQRLVVAEDGTTAPYDRLLLATGSEPVMLPLPGHELPGVIAFRDLHDVETMLQHSRSDKNAVVIGGGLLGLEAANGLMQQGMQVTVVHLADSLMERQLDAEAGGLLQRSLQARGLDFRLGCQTEAILGEERVRAVRFNTGEEIPADLVVMAVGIRPNIEAGQGQRHPLRARIVVVTTRCRPTTR
jgi:nitrite reductase (NADH) large subunit